MDENKLQAVLVAALMALRAKYPDLAWIIDAVLSGLGANVALGFVSARKTNGKG